MYKCKPTQHTVWIWIPDIRIFNRTTFRLVVPIRNLNEKVALLLGRPSKYCTLVQHLEHGLNNGLITHLLTIWIPNWSDSDSHCTCTLRADWYVLLLGISLFFIPDLYAWMTVQLRILKIISPKCNLCFFFFKQYIRSFSHGCTTFLRPIKVVHSLTYNFRLRNSNTVRDRPIRPKPDDRIN